MTLHCPIDATELRVLQTWWTVELDGFAEHVAAMCTAVPICHTVAGRVRELEAIGGS